MRNPASKFRTTAVMGLLLLGAGSQLAAAQTSVPQQLNNVRKQVNQAGPPANAQPQAKPPSSSAQPAVKPQAPATTNAQTKTSTPSGPQAQTKTPPAATPANPATAKAQAGKPGAASTASTAQVKPGAQPPVKVVSVKPAGTELAPKGQPAATTKAVAAPGAQPKATPAVAEVPVPPVAEHVARRDPFDPLVDKAKDSPSGPQAPLPAGKPGLVVATLRIDGIVKGTSGMIAIVSNPQSRVYFLREGDHLYDGEVEHISMEGVAFHQTGKDAFGKPVEREVTKRLYPTPGEQQ